MMGILSSWFKPKTPPILIVEDDDALALYIGEMLATADYESVRAKNGRDGLDLARSARPRLILLDMNMPVMRGPEALKLLKADPETQKIPVIMVTAEQKGKDIEEAFASGACGYVIKPVRREALLQKIQSALAAPQP